MELTAHTAVCTMSLHNHVSLKSIYTLKNEYWDGGGAM